MRKLFCYVVIILSLTVSSCSRQDKRHYSFWEKNVDKLNTIREYIEVNYDSLLNNTDKRSQRIVFIDGNKIQNISEDYIDNDKNIIQSMSNLKLKEIRFERKKCGNNAFGEIYFQVEKFNYYPIVYFVYEYCGVTEELNTATIYYKPLNDKWSLLIDSNYP